MRFKVVDFLRDTSGLVDLSEVQCVLHVESLVTFPCLDLVGGLGRFYYGGRIRGHQTEYACRSNARTHGHPITAFALRRKQKQPPISEAGWNSKRLNGTLLRRGGHGVCFAPFKVGGELARLPGGVVALDI
jgi:hypothetical protein